LKYSEHTHRTGYADYFVDVAIRCATEYELGATHTLHASFGARAKTVPRAPEAHGHSAFFFFFYIRRNSLESDTKNKTATIHLIFNPSDPRLLILNSQLLTQSGMDFFVVLERPGFRVAKRRRKQSKIGAPHKLKKTDAMTFFKKNFEGIILNKAYE
jgi:hypothetical protein